MAFGCVVVNNSTECRIARQYLCQASLFLLSLSLFSLASSGGELSGYQVW